MILAGLLECAWALGLTHTEGWTKPLPSFLTFSAMALSVWLLTYALRGIPIGTAYAVWTAIGSVGVLLFGIFVLGESTHPARLLFLTMIIVGVIGLKWFSTP